MEKLPLLLVRLTPGPLLISQRPNHPPSTHTHMPSNANLVSQMLRERHEMPQKCHHSTPVTGSSNPSIPLVNISEHTLICMCVFVCDGVGGDQLVVFSLWVPVSAWSSRVVPIIPSLLSSRRAQRPGLEVRHFWHPLTLLRYKSQQLRSQKTL